MINGPRILAAGRCVTPTAQGNDAFGALYQEIDAPEQAHRAVRREISQGADFIKYMATGAVLNPGGIPGDVITTQAELQALVNAANELHTYIDLEGFRLAPFLEFQARRDMGMTPLEMLKQATIDSARIVGLDTVTGSIKVGKAADLMVLSGRPDENYADLAVKPEIVFAAGKRFIG